MCVCVYVCMQMTVVCLIFSVSMYAICVWICVSGTES